MQGDLFGIDVEIADFPGGQDNAPPPHGMDNQRLAQFLPVGSRLHHRIGGHVYLLRGYFTTLIDPACHCGVTAPIRVSTNCNVLPG